MNDPGVWEPTEIEYEILRQIAVGAKAEVVAKRLGISDSTLRRHLRVIRRELGAESTAHAIHLATKRGLI